MSDPLIEARKKNARLLPQQEPITTTALDGHSHAALEECANALLDKLPGYIAEHTREVAYVYNKQPLWSVVAGHVLAAYEHGTLATPILDPSWPRHFDGVGLDLAATRYVCEWCREPFTPARYRQRFCSQGCGTASLKPTG